MKRRLLYFLAVLVLVIVAGAFFTERSKRASLARLAPFAEFNVWRRFGVGNFTAEPFDLFAYPSDIAFHKLPDDPSIIASTLWSLPGLRSVRINFGGDQVPRSLLVGAKTSRIKVLDLDGATLDEGTLEEVSGAPCLEVLILTGSNLRSFPLMVLPKLKELWLGQSQITDQGLEHAFDLASLETLDFSGSGISKIDPRTATRLPKLARLRLGDTQVSQSNVDELRKALPNTEILY